MELRANDMGGASDGIRVGAKPDETPTNDTRLAQNAANSAIAGTGRRAIAQADQRTTVVLPEGASLDTLRIDGDNLIVTLSDGSQMVIIDAAIYDVDLVMQGTTVPDENWKDYLGVGEGIESEAGNTPSSGGNFDDPVLPIGPAYGLGDLLPYTELQFPVQDNVEIGQYPLIPTATPGVQGFPTISANAGSTVDEDGLPARTGDKGAEPAGTMEQSDGETTVATIQFAAPGGVGQILVEGATVLQVVDGVPTANFQPIPLGPGVLTIIGVDLDNGTITYGYTLTDNTDGPGTSVDFDVTVVTTGGRSHTGNVVIQIVDDVPVAVDDNNLATLPDEASGAVVGTVEQIVANDDYGADGVGNPAITIGSGSHGGTIAVLNGVLLYTSAVDLAPGEVLVESFTYTIRDGDGSVSNEAVFTITLTEHGPSLAAVAANIAVDEDGLPGGIADIDSAGAAATGILDGLDFGADGVGDIALGASGDTGLVTLAGNAVETVWDAATHTLTGQDAVTGEAVFTLIITDIATGAYSFSLLSPVRHAGSGEDVVSLTVAVAVTDRDGDSVAGTIAITIGDDSPTIVLTGEQPGTALLDESPLSADGIRSAAIDFSGSFAAAYGADGQGTVTYALNLSGSDVGSGILALNGTEIVLNMADGVITGSAEGVDYFTLSVEDAGKVTFAFTGDYANVRHGDMGDHDDIAALIADAGAITLIASISDADGDGTSAVIDLGTGLFVIGDDGPTVNASANGEAGHVAVTSDAAIPDSDTIDLAAIFAANADYGTDGAGTFTATYGVTLTGTDTGLTSGGLPIMLSISGNAVIGATASGTVFTVTVDADTGVLTLTQSAAIDHAPGSDVATLANGLIQAHYSVTVTDSDGDSGSSSAHFDLGGNLVFNDDLPFAAIVGGAPSVRLDESLLAPDGDGIHSITTDFSGNFAFTDSADAPNGVSYALELAADGVASGLYALDTGDVIEGDGDGIGQGDPILLSIDGGDVVGMANGIEYFRISLNEATGEVTFTRSENIWHPEAGFFYLRDDGAAIELPADVLKLTATIADADGDNASAAIDLGNKTFTIEDDGPSVEPSTKYTPFELSGTTDYALIAHGNLNFRFGTDGMLGGTLGTAVLFEIIDTSSVNGIALTHIEQPIYDPVDGVWKFSFDYVDSNGQTGSNSGEIGYDGSNFQLTLADSFQFTSVTSVAGAVNSTTYEAYGISNGQSEILVNELVNGTHDPIFVQFTGFAGGLNAGGDNVLSSGESVTGMQTWISTSNSAFGVAGDTIQKGEMLEMRFHSLDPYQYDFPATSFVSGLTFTLDGVNGTEDFVVILKLADPNDPGTILETRTVIVGAEDVYRATDTIPDGFGAPALDNDDGFVIIEANDYLQGSEAYVIVGAQLMSSTSGLTGIGVDLNRATGDAGASTGTTAFGGTTDDDDVVKISDIGLIRSVIDEQAVSIDVRITVTDSDGDKDFTSIHINPFHDPIVLDMNGDGLHFQSLDNGVLYDIDGDGVLDRTAWIGAGDAILVRDANGNGIVDDASEFIFHEPGMTDLQTLRALYGDALDASDADFGSFGIWMDNGDGVFQAGEFLTLAEAGITDIALVSDGTATGALDGEIQIMGTGTFNGGTGTLVDAAFRYQSGGYQSGTQPGEQRAQELATMAAFAPALLATATAQAEAPFPADTMVNFRETANDQTMDVSPIGPEDKALPPSAAQVALGTLDDLAASELPEPHPSADMVPLDDAGLAPVIGATLPEFAALGASSETAAGFGAEHAPSADGDGSAQIIEALLQLSAAPPSSADHVDHSPEVVRAALAEVTGNDAVSNLVRQIIDLPADEAQGAADHGANDQGDSVHGSVALLYGQVTGLTDIAIAHGAGAPSDHGDDLAMLAASTH